MPLKVFPNVSSAAGVTVDVSLGIYASEDLKISAQSNLAINRPRHGKSQGIYQIKQITF